MKKTLLVVVLAIVIMATTTTLAFASTTTVTATVVATPGNFDVIIGNDSSKLESYVVEGANYVGVRYLSEKLVDVFNVYWDKNVKVETEKPYNGDSVLEEVYEQTTTMTESIVIIVDGDAKNVSAINIGGRYYIKLRDIAETTKCFNVYWDDEKHIVVIEKHMPYTGVAPQTIATQAETPTLNVFKTQWGDVIIPTQEEIDATKLPTWEQNDAIYEEKHKIVRGDIDYQYLLAIEEVVKLYGFTRIPDNSMYTDLVMGKDGAIIRLQLWPKKAADWEGHGNLLIQYYSSKIRSAVDIYSENEVMPFLLKILSVLAEEPVDVTPLTTLSVL